LPRDLTRNTWQVSRSLTQMLLRKARPHTLTKVVALKKTNSAVRPPLGQAPIVDHVMVNLMHHFARSWCSGLLEAMRIEKTTGQMDLRFVHYGASCVGPGRVTQRQMRGLLSLSGGYARDSRANPRAFSVILRITDSLSCLTRTAHGRRHRPNSRRTRPGCLCRSFRCNLQFRVRSGSQRVTACRIAC
jgi:hypothetical protein